MQAAQHRFHVGGMAADNAWQGVSGDPLVPRENKERTLQDQLGDQRSFGIARLVGSKNQGESTSFNALGRKLDKAVHTPKIAAFAKDKNPLWEVDQGR